MRAKTVRSSRAALKKKKAEKSRAVPLKRKNEDAEKEITFYPLSPAPTDSANGVGI